MGRWLAVLALTACVAYGCGGEEPSSRIGQESKPRRAAPVTGPGKLVDIGTGRSLYLACVGSGSPTVVLEAGFGGNTHNWGAVQHDLGETTRTCAYDRAGLGSSLPLPGVHDAGDEIRDLERLLDHADIQPPYVLVGHSYGGLLARLFASEHPDEIGGVVLVDAVGPDQHRRLLPIWRALPANLRRAVPKPGATEIGVDVGASQALADQVTTLGATPHVVITRGRPGGEGPPLPRNLSKRGERLWLTMQDELAALSSDRVHVVALRSDHFVQASQPDVVIRGVQAVVQAARSNEALPPCQQVFSGLRVRCRP